MTIHWQTLRAPCGPEPEWQDAARGTPMWGRRAVFLDRDGVLNRNVFYADTQAWESPRTAAELQLTAGVGSALRALREAGFLLLLVSNQPNVAKGKCSERELAAIHARLLELLALERVCLDEAFYCLHHPAFTGPCQCRKPHPYFLLEAAKRFHLDLQRSWMIGDRGTDVECGRRAGVRTVWIENKEGVPQPGGADLVATGIEEAAQGLLAFAPPSHLLGGSHPLL